MPMVYCSASSPCMCMAAHVAEARSAQRSACTVMGMHARMKSATIDSPACMHAHADRATELMRRAECMRLRVQLFREALLAEDFQEIHTPKLIAGASEGGAAVSAASGSVSCLIVCCDHLFLIQNQVQLLQRFI